MLTQKNKFNNNLDNFKSFRHFCEGLSAEDIAFEKTLPEVDYEHETPEGMLYRWIPPDGLEEYTESTTMEPVTQHSKEIDIDPGIDQFGEEVGTVGGIPFWEETHKFYGYAEPFLRIVLDKEKLLADGYTLFDPHRDPGEVRIAEPIKNWRSYLIVMEINRSEFALQWDDELDEYYAEFPMPLDYRKRIYQQLQKFPQDKIVWLDDEWFVDNVK